MKMCYHISEVGRNRKCDRSETRRGPVEPRGAPRVRRGALAGRAAPAAPRGVLSLGFCAFSGGAMCEKQRILGGGRPMNRPAEGLGRQGSASWPGNRRRGPSGRSYRPYFSHDTRGSSEEVNGLGATAAAARLSSRGQSWPTEAATC